MNVLSHHFLQQFLTRQILVPSNSTKQAGLLFVHLVLRETMLVALPRDRDFVARRVSNVDDVLGVFFGNLALPLSQGLEVVKDS